MSTSRIDRRTFIAGGAGLAASGLVTGHSSAYARAARMALPSGGAFPEGLASGEPGVRAITLWTRVEGVQGGARIGYEVARDPGFRRVVADGRATADAGADSTARVRLQGGRLQPGEQYYYRFFTRDRSTQVGAFRTARPAGSREPVRIGFWSCQEFIAGYYAAHRDMAEQDLDLVVCLGDYVYEQAFADSASPVPPVRVDNSAPDGESETLAEYRAKYRLYHSDPDLRELRRRHPIVAIWDDHEVEDNYADGIPGGASRPPREVPFEQRKRNGYRAWWEHLPRTAGTDRIYGSISLGAAELFLLDTRQFRDDQPCNPSDGPFSQPCPPQTTNDPSRTLLGRRQLAWLKDGLRRSRAAWKLIGNQVMITSLDAPPRNPLNTDSWDGYGAERAELIDHLGRHRIEDVSFLTGDIHTFFAGDVTRTGRQAVRGVDTGDPVDGPPRATEFVGGGISSPGIVDRFAVGEAERNAAAAPIDAAVLANNPQIAYSNQAYKGYGIVEAGRDELRVRYRAVRDARRPDSDVFTLRRFRVESGRPVVIDQGGPLPLPAPSSPGAVPDGLVPRGLSLGAPG